MTHFSYLVMRDVWQNVLHGPSQLAGVGSSACVAVQERPAGDQLIAESVMGSWPKIARFNYRRKVRSIPPQVKPKFMLSRSVTKNLQV